MYSVHFTCVHSEMTSGETFVKLNIKDQNKLLLYQKQY